MIIDTHTHIFPPEVREHREDYLRRDPTFAEMYASPKAKIATAEDLLRSMEASGVHVSVALGFAWREQELIARHNDYLLDAAKTSGGRIIPFATVNMTADSEAVAKEAARCANAGARGLGELRPESQGWDLNGEPGERLARLALRHGLVLLFHVTEAMGHDYPGKQGLRLESFHRFAVAHPDLRIVGAHLGGGLPFEHEPKELRSLSHVYVDTAARCFLYADQPYPRVIERFPAERLLLGSDYPLVRQGREMDALRAEIGGQGAVEAVLGGNAARLLGPSDVGPGPSPDLRSAPR